MFRVPVRVGISGLGAYRGFRGLRDVAVVDPSTSPYAICVAASATQTIGGSGACDGLTGDPKNYHIMGMEITPTVFYIGAAAIGFILLKKLRRR